MLGNENEVCRSSTVEFLTDFTATSLEQVLATAATKSMLTAQVLSLLAPGTQFTCCTRPRVQILTQQTPQSESARRSTPLPPLVEQQCKDHVPPLVRQLSLCSSEPLAHVALPHPHPIDNTTPPHHQQCFWTDTSRQAEMSVFDSWATASASACTICDPEGLTCTSVYEPLRAWTVPVDSVSDHIPNMI